MVMFYVYSAGSFYRICSAFKYGARKLGWILLLPAERISDELNKFFANTLDRHESKHQTNVQNNAVLELGEDFDSHCLNLQYSPLGHRCATSPPLFPSPPLSPQQWKDNPWEVTCESLESQQNINSRTNINGVAWGTHAYHANGSSLSVPPFREEKTKPRGTGTYIPNAVVYFVFYRFFFFLDTVIIVFVGFICGVLVLYQVIYGGQSSCYGSYNVMVIFLQSFQNYRPYKDRHWAGRGRKEAAGTYTPFQRHAFSYVFPAAPQESISPGKGNHELSEVEYPALSTANSATSDYRPPQLSIWEPFHDNGFSNQEMPESRSSSPQSWEEVPMPEVHSLQLSGVNEERWLNLANL